MIMTFRRRQFAKQVETVAAMLAVIVLATFLFWFAERIRSTEVPPRFDRPAGVR